MVKLVADAAVIPVGVRLWYGKGGGLKTWVMLVNA